MTWVRIDDDINEHPKIARLDDHAFALFVAGLAYCNRNLTDGFIPYSVGIGQLRWSEGNTAPSINQLEASGLWEKAEGGWQVHDYSDYQPTRAQVEAERAQKRAAGRAGGLAAAKARALAVPGAGAQAESKPVPVPKPVTRTPKGAEGKGAARENGQAPNGDETYLLEQLHRSPVWKPVTHGAVVRLNQAYGRGVVTLALQRAVEETRYGLEISSSPYGLLEAMCRDVAR